MAEAAEHSQSDAKRRSDAELRIGADGLLYSVEQMLEQYTEKLDDATQTQLREGVTRVKKALEAEGAADLKDAIEALQELAYESTSAIYGQRPSGSNDDDDTGGTAGFIDD